MCRLGCGDSRLNSGGIVMWDYCTSEYRYGILKKIVNWLKIYW